MNIKPNSLKTLFAQRDPNSEYIDNLTLGELCNYMLKDIMYMSVRIFHY